MLRTGTGTGSQEGSAGQGMNPRINLNDVPLQCRDELELFPRHYAPEITTDIGLPFQGRYTTIADAEERADWGRLLNPHQCLMMNSSALP